MYLYEREGLGECRPTMYLYDSPRSSLRSQNLGQPMYILEHSPGTLSRFGEPPAAQADLILDEFDFNRADLKQKHLDQLVELVTQIVQSWARASTRPAVGVRAVGHTDEVGSDDYNLGLGRRRAQAVLGRLTGALITGGNFNLYQIMNWSVESQGKRSRVSSVPEKNRRVEIFIQWGTVKTPPPPPPPRRPPDPRCVAGCLAQEKRCFSQTRFPPECLIGRARCIEGC